MLVGKFLTKADVEQCRVVLPRMAMEANMPEVVDAKLLHVVSSVTLLSCCSCCLAYGTYSCCLSHAVHLPGHHLCVTSVLVSIDVCCCAAVYLVAGDLRNAQVVLLHDP